VLLRLPGKHNLLNAVAAAAAALFAGAPADAIQKGLSTFHGAGRRFEVLYRENGITVMDDYGHHPAEIEATLKSLKGLPFRRILAVFQPFTYSRTKMLLDEFARVLSFADITVLSQI